MNQRARSFTAKLQKKQAILAAAREIFFSQGYERTTIQLIARKAGISVGTLYLYYANKRDVYKALQNDALDILNGEMQQVMAWQGISALEKLRQMAKAYFRFYREHRQYFDILSIQSASPAELKESESELSRIIDGKARGLLKMLERAIVEGIKNKELMAVDPWKTASVLWGLMDGLVILRERRNIETVIDIDLEALIEHALQMTFYGIVLPGVAQPSTLPKKRTG